MRNDKRVPLKGVASHPYEIGAEDGTLDCAVNLINDGSGLKPLFPPKSVDSIPEGFKLLYVHRHGGYTHYILRNPEGKLAFQDKGEEQTTPIDSDTTQVDDIVHVGNTLLFLSPDGIEYQLWKEGRYKKIGNKIPELDIRFGLGDRLDNVSDLTGSQAIAKLSGYLNEGREKTNKRLNNDLLDERRELSREVAGVVNKIISVNTDEAGRFCHPFLVRYAYRMFDGTLTHHSQPVLMIPSTGNAPAVFYMAYSTPINTGNIISFISTCSLYRQIETSSQVASLQEWSDVIRSVDIFISKPFYTHRQDGQIDGFYAGVPESYSLTKDKGWEQLYKDGESDNTDKAGHIRLSEYSQSELQEQIKSCGDFYFLTSCQIKDLSAGLQKVEVPKNYLSGLVNRERMSDDWDSHDTLIAKRAFVYNGRVNLSGISKKLHKWNKLSNIIPLQPGSANLMAASIKMNIEGDTKVFNTEEMPGDGLYIPRYIFIGNTNATSISFHTIHGVNDCPLQPHPTLNGAVFVNYIGKPVTTAVATSETYPALPSESADATVQLPNKLYTGEINNPFKFPVSGIHTIGTGEILSVSSAYKALSPGQFGQFPLYVFTDDGIWALGVGKEGQFTNMQPISTDVPEDPNSVTQIDDMVAFISKKGLVVLKGADSLPISDAVRDHRFRSTDWEGLNQAMKLQHAYFAQLPQGSGLSCVGEPFEVSFSDISEQGKIAYDYVHRRIIVYRNDRPIAYVYSLQSKLWGMQRVDYSETIKTAPYSFVTDSKNRILDLSTEDATRAVPVVMVTRAIDFEAPEMLKTVYKTIIEGKHTNGNAVTISSILYGSNDYDKYGILNTSIDNVLSGRGGSPVKAVRVAMFGGYTKDNYTGSTIHTIEPKRTNKIR